MLEHKGISRSGSRDVVKDEVEFHSAERSKFKRPTAVYCISHSRMPVDS